MSQENIVFLLPDFPPIFSFDGEHVALCREKIALAEFINRIFCVEKKEEVFAGFREEKGLLAVFEGFVGHVVDGGVAASGFGVVV